MRLADKEAPPNRANASWSFTVNAIPQPSGAFTFTWIADGGYFEGTKETAATAILGEHLLREKADPPALLIFGGDVVENDQQINYDRAVAALGMVAAPRLVAAGNHEISGTLSRDRFWRTFGPTIATVDFGPVDFLVVDSASSSLESDTSQFAWIEAELARSDARTVFVLLHVPTRDPFASSHGLPVSEGQRLENIFAAAKAARPSRDIVVLSGDSHAYGRWSKDGVTYVISGGGGGGPDAPPQHGGFYHRLHVSVGAEGVATIHVIPLFKSAVVSPSSATLLGGETRMLSATGNVFTSTAPDMTIDIADPVERRWTANDPSIVVVDPRSDFFEALVPGKTEVMVTSGGVSARGSIEVIATTASVRALTLRSFDASAVRDNGLKTALLQKLDNAAHSAAGAMNGYIALLRAQRGKQVNAAWADRLIANAEYVDEKK